ncbi:MAG: polysaccharide deacetylase family protein [Firmicutes bacterium]|nr:polysaccharide deacetylase family protein [Bacillota bacterium]
MRRGFSMIITKKRLFSVFFVLLVLGLAFWGPKLLNLGQRQLFGVKKGVCLEGNLLAGLLAEELYDAVASIGESYHVQVQNAAWDWDSGAVSAEVVGQIVDIPATVEALLEAPAYAELNLVTLTILPSITAAHFSPYYRGPREEPKVALMINVDWGNEFIPGILEVLAHYNAEATWFLTGRWASAAPELAKQIALAGHESGNHGGWHGMAGKMNRAEVTRLVLEGEEKIMAATGQKPLVFAPPAGDFNEQTVVVAAELGYKTVLWTVDTVDWQRPAPTVIVDRVLSKISGGALVLMHPTQPTLEALPVIIDHLHNRGFLCVTVSELLAD